MSDSAPGPGVADEVPPPRPVAPADELADELKAALDWVRQLSAAGSTYSRLFALELRLALADSGRLLVLGLLMLPVALLAWIGLGVLLAWLVYHYSQSVGFALGAFFLLQLMTMAALGLTCRRYSKSLSLPATRRHLNALLAEVRDEPGTTER